VVGEEPLMAAAIREQILEAMKATLATALPDVGVDRNADRPAEHDRRPWLNLIDGSQPPPSEETAGYKEYVVSATLEGVAEKGDADNPGTPVVQLYADALVALMADRTVGGLAQDVVEGALDLAIDRESSAPGGSFTLDLIITFWTRTNDPTQPGPN
jgi:hypothetical protein